MLAVMPHHTPLIGTIVAGLVIAFVMGALAHRLKMPPIAGYLLAGVIVGPFTPGFVADGGLAAELAEIGIILLMFGVGLHFSLKDLLAVRRIALPGAIVQIVVATALGTALGLAMGWDPMASGIFGLALSVASTVVLLRALQSRNLVQTEQGRIAVGWLIVEDLAMVVALVLLPALVAMQRDGGQDLGGILRAAGLVVVKVGGFLALMLLVGRKLIPALLHWAAHSGSRELFRLAVLATALGVAFGAALVFGMSFALGAFFAGMILGETQLSRRAAEETLPLRDAFAVLFFVSVGMLFDPAVLIEQPLPLLATLAIIVLGKSLAAFAIVRGFGHSGQTAVTISASLAQIGEFSFILASLGVGLEVLPATARDLILAGAILSILINPLLFSLLVKRARPAADGRGGTAAAAVYRTVLIGYGRVGCLIAHRIRDQASHLAVIEDQGDTAAAATRDGFSVVLGNATDPEVLARAQLADATTLVIAIPGGIEAGAIAARARATNPSLRIIARAHSDEDVANLKRRGADVVVMAEEEAANRMAAIALRSTQG